MIRLVSSAVALACGLLLLGLSAVPASAERRVALVIGNSAYQNAPKLDNPASDATSVAEMFKSIGFDVVDSRRDLGNLEFKRALREFMNLSDRADIAVIYYAGHGMEADGRNYLIPVDAKLESDYDARDEAVDLERIFESLDAKRLRLVILDACRDNPFVKKMKHRYAMRATTAGGLAPIEIIGTDTLVAYAAKAGSTAEDGRGEHSPFTGALLKFVPEPGLDVRMVFGKVRDDVYKNTRSHQEPFVYGSLGGETISLVPPKAQPKAAPAADAAVDIQRDYEFAERVGTVGAWDSFLRAHSIGLYADFARDQRNKLMAALPPPPEPPKQKSEAERSWDKIKDTGDAAALREFIARFSESPLALIAQHQLDIVLERQAAQRRAEEERRGKAAAEAERERAERAWDKLKTSTDTAALRDFMQRFPSSARASEVQRRVETLEREAAQRREDEEKRAKAAAEAARQKAEREAVQRREDEEKRAKAAADAERQRAEAERQKAEREAAQRREDEEKRAKAASEAERQKLEREVAQRREEEARQVKAAAEAERQKIEKAWEKLKETTDTAALREFKEQFPASPRAQDAQKRLDALERAAAQKREEDEKRAKTAAEAERHKAEREAAKKREEEEKRAKTAAEAERQKAENELVRTAQAELSRIGCFAGREDGALNQATKEAVQRYRSKRGQPTGDLKITASLVDELKGQAKIESCIAAPKQEKPEPVAHPKPKQEEEREAKTPRHEKPRREEEREAKAPHHEKPQHEKPQREERREAREPRRESQPRARSEAAAAPRQAPRASGGGSGGGGGGGGGTMTGVGF